LDHDEAIDYNRLAIFALNLTLSRFLAITSRFKIMVIKEVPNAIKHLDVVITFVASCQTGILLIMSPHV
jgi:hypothetical protein